MISLPIRIRHSRPQELSTVIDRLDQEFVVNRRRSLSLRERFPHSLSLDNIERVLVAATDEAIWGALSIRMFEWVVEDHSWPAAMVGMVWVDSLQRGKGIGSILLCSAMQLLRDSNVAFGVLWTGNPAFYERAGWFLSDRGVFGQVSARPTSPRIATVSCRPLASEDVASLERQRACSLGMRVVRYAIDYRTIPIPATQVLCFSVDSDHGEGFALVGQQDDEIGYLYEMIAPPCLWGTLLAAVTERYPRLFVNGHSNDPFAQWLADNRLVGWRPQQKTMWLRISNRIDERSIGAWHIPYYDWI